MSWVKIDPDLNALLQCYACEISQDTNGYDSFLQVAVNIVIGLYLHYWHFLVVYFTALLQ
jgi:hypothetical protein